MSDRTHLVVGAGKMGGALLEGWINSKVITPEQLIILDPSPGDAAQKAISEGALHLIETDKNASNIRYLLLAIKPQMFKKLAPPIALTLPEKCLVISILAGTSLASLQSIFKDQAIIRAMPNTPAAIGKGLTAYTKGGNISAAQTKEAEKLLAAGGDVFHVETEHLIDVVTAVSGSGPAYVFHMTEALEAAAVKIGLPEELAPKFARQTIIGAAGLLEESELSASDLRKNVTSPNGTTEAALDVLMGLDGLPTIMRETVKAALRRAKELADT
ncbi:pyrroline-5-carboxylate reductase [Hellea balneolensis]|uniref:pyrroline-5-carboxylate reductase n=1 Tax=Hellea balneolensis TaxID=287478 RepID=UPI0004187B8C|nr:pyrroline-5-carboxylate reductase [Hellea balneolensis]